MFTQNIAQQKREFLMKIYNANESQSFNYKKHTKRQQASRLIKWLDNQFDFKPTQSNGDTQNVTWENITHNGKYSLD